MEQDFSGRVAIVTGGGSGIGEATAELLAERGAKVLVVDLDAAAAERVAKQIGPAALAFSVDVSDPGGCAAMVRTAVDAFGRLDVVVNNAGIPAMLAAGGGSIVNMASILGSVGFPRPSPVWPPNTVWSA